MNSPKSIDDWKISKKAKGIVAIELGEWINVLVAEADGRMGNVFDFDVTTGDIFYFTDCIDIVGETKEEKAVEDDLSIRRRKQMVFCQLVLKQILYGPTHRRSKCSHCGHKEVRNLAIRDGSGHMTYCPICKCTNICTYPFGYKHAGVNIIKTLYEYDYITMDEVEEFHEGLKRDVEKTDEK